MQTIMENEKPSYKLAQERAEALYNELGFTHTISKPQGKMRGDWPCIHYKVSFLRNGGKFETDYHLGIGHVKWSFLPYPFRYEDLYERVFQCIKSHRTLNKEYNPQAAKIAASLAKDQKIEPKPWEVLAYCCRDALDAMSQTWEEYAANYGYDADSIKAKEAYDYCLESYPRLRQILANDQIEELANLANEF